MTFFVLLLGWCINFRLLPFEIDGLCRTLCLIVVLWAAFEDVRRRRLLLAKVRPWRVLSHFGRIGLLLLCRLFCFLQNG